MSDKGPKTQPCGKKLSESDIFLCASEDLKVSSVYLRGKGMG